MDLRVWEGVLSFQGAQPAGVSSNESVMERTRIRSSGGGTRIPWSGVVTSVQPRIRLSRSFDEVCHTYLGYVLAVSGHIGGEERDFCVAIGRAAHAKHGLKAGDAVSGEGTPVADSRLETAELYKISKLKCVDRAPSWEPEPPPWEGVPPQLPIYRDRGHRRLDARTYDRECTACIWGCRMAVEMIIDPWNPDRRFRTETFCYGPLSCPLYKAGPTRRVPGRRGMIYVEEDWIDQDATSHRGPDN